MDKKIAIVHDWLVSMRGGERVLEVFIDLFPDAEIFTIVSDKNKLSPKITGVKINNSFVSRLPFSRKFYRHYLLFHPSAVESFDLRGFDVVISLSHCAAKGCLVPQGIPHFCYMFTPMRYAYDMFYQYFNFSSFGMVRKMFFALIFNYLRTWDYVSAQRADKLATISEFVKKRITRYYTRDSKVIYPPVDLERFNPLPDSEKRDYYLIVSALVPYKKIEIAIEAFNVSGKKLLIIGTGPEEKRLKKLVRGNNISFSGFLRDEEVNAHYRQARGFIFPGIEDFGLTMVESLASGTPVIAFKGGGAEEIISKGVNGIFFKNQTPEALREAVDLFEKSDFSPKRVRESAERFSLKRFKSEILTEIKELSGNHEK